MDVSYTGTRNVLELARLFDVESILLFSSEVYGTPDPQAIPTPESFIGRIRLVIVAVMILVSRF